MNPIVGRLGGQAIRAATLCLATLASTLVVTDAVASGAEAASQAYAYSNHLVDSNDPYLLLHAHNPVDWYPWGAEALSKAKRENKPIFVSIGYSTCYWCHVAEREIYSNPEIAKLMNLWFINIKVDREERPDIDRIYMLARQIMTGMGGWPNNVFLTPDLKPFYAGSYFPPEDRDGHPGFKSILEHLQQAWSDEHTQVAAVADQVYQALRQNERGGGTADLTSLAPWRWTGQAVIEADRRFDQFDGGFEGANIVKFPRAPLLSLLLNTSPNQDKVGAKAKALETLKAMAVGGLMDQLAGGFHRYSTEPSWSVPHFEKMLYDNAQLLSLYAHAYAITKEHFFRQVAMRTAHYLTGEMQVPAGGFHSAQDAESEGTEGASYVWTRQQIETVLGEADTRRFMALYRLTPMPPALPGHRQADGGVLRLDREQSRTLAKGKQLASSVEALQPLRDKLLAARDKRPQPARDEKIVTADNALAVIGFAEAGHWLNDTELTTTAKRTANGLWQHAFDPASGKLTHQFFGGHPGGDGFLDDYALLGRAFLALYRYTGDRVWLSRARQITDAMLERFVRPDGILVDTSNRADLLIAPPSEGDSAQPSGQSTAIALLLELSTTGSDDRYAIVARRALAPLAAQIAAQPSAWGTLMVALSQPRLVAELEKTPRVEPKNPLDSANHVHVKTRLAPTKAGIDLIVTVEVDPGYHINANPASDPDLIPTQLTLPGHPDLKVDYPTAQRFKAPFAPQGIAVYQGRVILFGHLSPVPAQAPSAANLRVQACNDEVCLAPATIAVTIDPAKQ